MSQLADERLRQKLDAKFAKRMKEHHAPASVGKETDLAVRLCAAFVQMTPAEALEWLNEESSLFGWQRVADFVQSLILESGK